MRYDRHAVPLPEIKVGSHVAIHNNDSKKFDIYGVIVEVGKYRKYVVRTASGRLLVRNRRFIRKRVPASVPKHDCNIGDYVEPASNNVKSIRPHRNVRKPQRLIEDPEWH